MPESQVKHNAHCIRNKGIITEEEFNAKKKQILALKASMLDEIIVWLYRYLRV